MTRTTAFFLVAAALLFAREAALASEAPTSASAAEIEMKAMDRNADGKVTRTEHAAGALAMFQQMDANRDGRVTVAEMDGAQLKIKASADTEPVDPEARPLSSAEKIAVVDTDRDGVLSAMEHADGAKQMFDAMDANRDGELTVEELQLGHDALLKKR